MFGITFDQWLYVCKMYVIDQNENTHKSYLQWYPYSSIPYSLKEKLFTREFYDEYIRNGNCVLFPTVTFKDKNYILKNDGTLRNATLISPLMYLVLQSVGKAISEKYVALRPDDIVVFYGGDYNTNSAHYKDSYYQFLETVDEESKTSSYNYYIKIDIKDFYDNINIDKLVSILDANINTLESVQITSSQLYLYKRLFAYCGGGHFPLVENSVCSSYLSTVVYLDSTDRELYNYLESLSRFGIQKFKMIRYVDDLYILILSTNNYRDTKQLAINILKKYNSIINKLGLSLNFSKCKFDNSDLIINDLKNWSYIEDGANISEKISDTFPDGLLGFLGDFNSALDESGHLTFGEYRKVLENSYQNYDLSLRPHEVFNHFIYNMKRGEESKELVPILAEIICHDFNHLHLDPKRLTQIVLNTGNEGLIKSILNSLFTRANGDDWNAYDMIITITYLLQRGFKHHDLKEKVLSKLPHTKYYGEKYCERSFIESLEREEQKYHIFSKLIGDDKKANYLYFMFKCEASEGNYMEAFAYFKSFFDRVTADIACRRNEISPVVYNKFYKESYLKKIYKQYTDSGDIISQAQRLRHSNPLAHASSELLDGVTSTTELKESVEQLWSLLITYAEDSNNLEFVK